MPMRPLLVATILCVAAGCSIAPRTKQSFRSPRGDYTIFVEKADLGGCCSTHITGRVDGFAPGKPVEIFEIRGAQEVSLAWRSPYALVATVCDATNITYKPRVWNEGLTNSLRVDVVNRQPRPPGDRQICD